jgi:hypothetical protein
MAEQKPQATEKPKGYFIGEMEQQSQQGRLLVEVVANPQGNALSPLQVEVEILNKLDAISNLIKSRF